MLEHLDGSWQAKVWMFWPILTNQGTTEVKPDGKTNQQLYDGIKAALDSGKQVILGTKNTIPGSIEEFYGRNFSGDHGYVVKAATDGKLDLLNPWGLGTEVTLQREHLSDLLQSYFVLEPTPTD